MILTKFGFLLFFFVILHSLEFVNFMFLFLNYNENVCKLYCIPLRNFSQLSFNGFVFVIKDLPTSGKFC